MVRVRVRVRVRVEGKEMLSEMRSIDNRTSENASFGASSSLAFLNQYPLLRNVELSITVMMVSCGEKSRIWSLK